MVTVDKDISGRILIKFQYDPRLVEKANTVACIKAGIRKDVSIHSLRHNNH